MLNLMQIINESLLRKEIDDIFNEDTLWKGSTNPNYRGHASPYKKGLIDAFHVSKRRRERSPKYLKTIHGIRYPERISDFVLTLQKTQDIQKSCESIRMTHATALKIIYYLKEACTNYNLPVLFDILKLAPYGHSDRTVFKPPYKTPSKLSDDNVREIMKLLKQGMPQKAIGLKFGINQATVCQIKGGMTHKHITKPKKSIYRKNNEKLERLELKDTKETAL